MSEFSWVTLATNDSYSLGALVLAHSLKRVGTKYQLVVMVTPGVTPPMREKLAAVFDLVFEVNILDSKDERNLLLLQRPELGITFTKLHCWRLTQFKKCVFLDADTLVLQNCDELFERDEFSAAPDVGWPDCFNSGVFVYAPSDDTFNSLLTFALERGSFDGGDQGLLNLYFSDWAHKDISKHLPFIYNMCSTASYSYLPAFKQFGENVKIVHFIGNSKPWLQYFNSETLQVTPTPGYNHLQMIFDHWWNVFCDHVHSNLAASMARIDSHIASSCTSSSHTFTHSINESKCEDSLCTSQSIAEINIPIWDPWENYNPIHDQLENKPSDNTVVVDNNNQTSIVNSFHETKHSHSIEKSINIDIKPSYSYDVNSSNLNISHQLNTSQNSNNNHYIEHQHFHNNQNNHTQNTNIENKITSPVPPSPHYISSPIHIESHSIPVMNYEVSNSQNACASCQTVNSATEQPNNTVSEPGNNEKGTEQNGGLAGAFAQMTLREPKSASQGALEEHLRRQGWEAGRIDYLGQDSFDNVWKKICETISAAPVKEPSPPKQLPVKQPSPPKEIVGQPAKQPSPPKEPSPLKEVEVQPPAPAVAQESTPAPIVAASEPACAVSTPEAPATPAPVAPISETPTAPAPVATSQETQPAPVPVAPISEIPATVSAAPESSTPAETTPEIPASLPVTPETVAPVTETPIPETPVVAAPVVPATETPVVAAPVALTPETPVVPTPEAQAAPETVLPVEPTPVPDTTTPVVAAEPAAPVTPSAEPTAPVATEVAPAATAETVAATAPTPEAVQVAAPEPIAPSSAAIPEVIPAAISEPAATPATTPEAVPVAAPESVATVPAETSEALKPTEIKAEEQKPKEATSAAPTEETKPASEVPQAATPPIITETPATPQTPDASKGEIKPEKSKPAEGQSSETPVPPPRKSGKNGGATTKKSKKK